MTELKTDIDIPAVKASTGSQDDEIDLGILLELGSIGAGHAATSLSSVLQELITIDVPKIHTLKPHLIPKYYNEHDVLTTAIYLQLSDQFGCDILLMFDSAEAKKIAAMMAMCAVDQLDAEMEKSALQELANILIGSFLTSISDFTGVQLMPTTPETVTDVFDAIIDHFLIKQSLVSDNALIFETRFKRNGEDTKCKLMIFPTEELKGMLVEKSKSLIGL
jgi:chemotaxis protein CheC